MMASERMVGLPDDIRVELERSLRGVVGTASDAETAAVRKAQKEAEEAELGETHEASQSPVEFTGMCENEACGAKFCPLGFGAVGTSGGTGELAGKTFCMECLSCYARCGSFERESAREKAAVTTPPDKASDGRRQPDRNNKRVGWPQPGRGAKRGQRGDKGECEADGFEKAQRGGYEQAHRDLYEEAQSSGVARQRDRTPEEWMHVSPKP